MSQPAVKPQLPNGNGNNAKLSKNQRRKLNAKKKQQQQQKQVAHVGLKQINVPKVGASPPAAVAEFLRNLSNPTYAMMIPRVVPTEAVPHHYQAGMDFNYPDEVNAGALIITPSLKVPVVESKFTSALEAYQNDKLQSMHHVGERYFDTWIDNDSGLRAVGGGSAITTSKLAVGYHYNEASGVSSVTTGGRYYKMKGLIVGSGECGIRITNRGNNATFYAGIWNVTNSGTRTGLLQGTTTIATGATSTINFPAFTQAVDAAGFGFGLRCVSATTDDISVDYVLQGNFNIGGGWSWEPREFFETPENGVIADFESADKFSVTAFSALLSNTSAAMHKGGSIRAAQLPGGTRRQLPSDPLDLYTYLGNYNTRHKLSGQLLADGAFWSYHPEKIQDVMFRAHTNPENEFLYADAELPYFVVAFTWANTEQKPSLALKLKMNLEYLTTSQVAPRFMSPADTGRLVEMWLSLASGVNHVSENPDHLNAVKRMVDSVINRTWNNPDFRSAAITSAKTLGKLALGAAMV